MPTTQTQPRTLDELLLEKKVHTPAPNQHANAPALSAPKPPSERLKKAIRAAKETKAEQDPVEQPPAPATASAPAQAPAPVERKAEPKPVTPKQPQKTPSFTPPAPTRASAPRPSLSAIKQLNQKQKMAAEAPIEKKEKSAPQSPSTTTPSSVPENVSNSIEGKDKSVAVRTPLPSPTRPKPPVSPVSGAPTPVAAHTKAPSPSLAVPAALLRHLQKNTPSAPKSSENLDVKKTSAPLAPPIPPIKQLKLLAKKNSHTEPKDLPDPYDYDYESPKQVVAVPPSTLKFLENNHKKELEEKVKKEARIDLSASKSLAALICSLAVNPGMGSEVSVDERREALTLIVTKTHELTDYLCNQIRHDGFVPDYLHGTLAQEVSKHLAYQWKNGADLEGEVAKLIASELFNQESPLFGPETYQKFSQEGRYEAASTDSARLEIEKAILNTLLKANSRVLSKKYSDFIFNYDSDQDMVATLRAHYLNKVFLFGKNDSIPIANQLTQIALGIAEEHRLDITDQDMVATWNVNAIYRAGDLVLSEYDMFIERSLHLAFSAPFVIEQELNNLTKTYDSIMKEIEERAQKNFNLIAKTARHLLSRSAYLSNQDQQKPESERIETNNPMPREVN